MDAETLRHIKRIERELTKLFEEDRLLRERIAASTGDGGASFLSASGLNGTLVAGSGLSGGGTFPGTVTLDVDLTDAWSGLEFSSDELQVDLDETFVWMGRHTFGVGSLGELLNTHTAMGNNHGLGGMVEIAPSASLRSTMT